MKRTIIAMMAAAAVFASCEEKNIFEGEGKGTLSLKVESSDEMNDKHAMFKSGGTEEINTDNFDVVISRDGEQYRTFKLGEMPELLEMVPGDYSVSVSSPDRLPVAWDQPVYFAEKEFKVMRDMVSPVEVKCTIGNVKVSVNCSDRFLSEVTGYSIVVTTADGALTWGDAEVKAGKTGWFEPAPMNVYVKGYRVIAPEEPAELDFKISEVTAADHIILNIDARTTGDLEIIYKDENGDDLIDGSLNDKEVDIEVPGFPETPVDRPDPEEPENPKPTGSITMSWEGNEGFAPMPLAQTMDVKINIRAEKGIKSFIVSVDSPVLTSLISGMNGGSPDMDMVNPSETLEGLFTDLDVPIKD